MTSFFLEAILIPSIHALISHPPLPFLARNINGSPARSGIFVKLCVAWGTFAATCQHEGGSMRSSQGKYPGEEHPRWAKSALNYTYIFVESMAQGCYDASRFSVVRYVIIECREYFWIIGRFPSSRSLREYLFTIAI